MRADASLARRTRDHASSSPRDINRSGLTPYAGGPSRLTRVCLQRPAADAPEYEKLSDTVKRRLDAPADAPDPERPELKKSRIPLALRSPAPIRRAVKEGGARSRGASLERPAAVADPPASLPSTPGTPGTPRKDSSTFNLLKDSDLFTQISRSKLEPSPPAPSERPADPCHVVAVTEHEIVKATVSSPEPADEAAVEFVPQRAARVAVLEAAGERRGSLDLGSEPRTFVVEVRTLEQRMRPTLGVLKKLSDDTNVPDLIPAVEKRPDCEFSTTRTPPPTPMEECEASPLDGVVVEHVDRDEVNEYLILDDVPLTTDDDEKTPEGERSPASEGSLECGSPAASEASGSPRASPAQREEEEVIYSEVEEAPQVNDTTLRRGSNSSTCIFL